ncbi:lysozyme [Bosea sp. F3-2]|uniref:lysozyme n=1 Tax=Bosea sp. F3-2 TaxID=2599640 RepID=UPI0011EDAE66|nr:lysozyme [Bosea sp. F3-2]QEL26165.1 lysozyme [Bosea sp. F3-2]
MKVTADVALETAAHEGLVRQTYRDSKGVLTWSIGVTNASGHNVDRYIGKPQPMEHCLAIYAWLLETRYAPAVREVFAKKPLTEAQFAAALSFHYNTGAIKSATWPKLWLAGDIAAAKTAFMAWNKPAEIVERRRKECDLFFGGKWSNNGRITEYTRVTAKMTPDGASAKRVDVRAAIAAALGAPASQAAEPAPAPPPPAPPPDRSIYLDPPAAEGGFWSRFWAGLKRSFGG